MVFVAAFACPAHSTQYQKRSLVPQELPSSTGAQQYHKRSVIADELGHTRSVQ
jgi:hypothetical protein